MRFLSFSTLFLVVLLSACGGNDTSVTTDATETASPGKFSAAQEALANDRPAAEVSKLLMDNFSAVSDSNTGALNTEASRDFAEIARKLADTYPADTAAAMPLYRSAEVVRALNDPKRAATIYRNVYERYPSFSKAPEALFMLAFTQDEDLKDYDSARKTYEDFLKSHPNHSFADDTEMLLKNLGKSDEEILKELEANMNKQQ